MLKSLRRKSLGSSINKSQSSQRNSISYFSVPTKDRGKDRTWVGKIPLSRIRNTPQNTTIEKDFCLVDESPFRMIKVASSGNLKEFERIYNLDSSRLSVQDSKGRAPIHQAALKGRIRILDFINRHGGDLNIKDGCGNTALHLAVEMSQVESIDFLVDAGADVTAINSKCMPPMHLAADGGLLKSLEALLKHDDVDVNQRGEDGITALHLCALKNQDRCAGLLLEYNAKVCITCNYGFYPIHLAAKSASAETLEVLIQAGIKNGYKREAMLSFKDMENNMPLHSAVHGGDLKVVEVCLKAGAPVNAQQDDKSTPLHFACAQGNLDMIRTMHDMQTDNFLSAIFITDVQNMTPLHRAAIFNHVPVVEFLIDKGADVNAKDIQERTPLLLAASKGGWETVTCLLSNKADIKAKDHNNRNFMHLAVKFGGKLNQFGCSILQGIQHYLNEKDDFGCTPLHYASKEGHLLAIDDLLNMGAVISPKNNMKQSPFHFAARYGRFNTCKRLLESQNGANIINETDGDGRTALHLAALNGHVKVVTLLLQKGAVAARDRDSNTPLHLAASSDYTRCMRLLLGVHANLLDVFNLRGDTALHVAALKGNTNAVTLLMTMGAEFSKNTDGRTFFDHAIEQGNSDVAMGIVGHDRWEDAMDMCSTLYCGPMIGLIKHMPEVCMAVLERCQTPSNHDKRSKDYYIEYNFKYLRSSPSHMLEKKKRGEEFEPMPQLNAMVRTGRVECLSHSVCVNFLQMKWNYYGKWIYSAYLFIYIAYLALLTTFIINHDSLQHHDRGAIDNSTMKILKGNNNGGYMFKPMYAVVLWLIGIYAVINMIKEVFQMVTQKWRYFTDKQNFLEWSLYISTLLFIAPFLFHLSFHWQWEAGALAVFLAWFNCLVFLQRFDFFGIYVVMFLEILKTLLQVICVFSILIIAFGLAFFMLLKHEESRAYSSPGLALLRTVTMMLEMDYMETFNGPFTDDNGSTLHFDTLTLFLLAVFVLLMPILLMNLLIGLAVGDIESVLRNARLKRLAMQVELHTDMERKMPNKLLTKVDKTTHRIYPNKCRHAISQVLSMVMSYDDESSDLCNDGQSCYNSYISGELYKQKTRMKELSASIDKSHQLLRLIVQKMEIQTEDEVWDEGLAPCDSLESMLNPSGKGVWRSSKSGRQMLQQSMIVTRWKRNTDKM
ncbi:transient receptor potential cation channel subfamily A member 1-like isoform X2 [Haliotis rufescens]|uniref:transient receptor potential cation channel subfamily A member 1-like isoform X2 n=1 Tax=Haliotis rufescens TaxID=6454 RepID=UPI00201E7DFA|nr:transient receptor potential cation channel subfamily A member 1-like isoform X2 [Haliotis rufescens]